MIRAVTIILLFFLTARTVISQCCASSGNPIGGTVNLGSLDKKLLRTVSYYHFSYSDDYYSGSKKYSGNLASVERGVSSYLGLLMGYGLSDNVTIEMETAYVIGKTNFYRLNDEKLSGYGFSDAVISVRPTIYRSPDAQFSISCALGSNIPLSGKLQQVNGVTLPVDLQPSTGSFGIVAQTNILKENSFRMISFLLLNRFEKYFENRQEYMYGNSFSTSVFFSKFFPFESQRIDGSTLILQLKNQIRGKNAREGERIDGSGNCSFYFIPQVNLTVSGTWHFSLLVDIPVYQYFNGIQLGNKLASSLIILKDFTF